MTYVCSVKMTKQLLNLNKMKNLNLILFFAVVTILATGIHFLTLSVYR